ncbi:MAG: hypothetical protein BWY70_00664 [Bacteroidetes bacterium ADurb.Bin408]|nr:MAG: hypothetical protein BWY70_00664 [Bacteroidetes bacterium ADurb.Bin408]
MSYVKGVRNLVLCKAAAPWYGRLCHTVYAPANLGGGQCLQAKILNSYINILRNTGNYGTCRFNLEYAGIIIVGVRRQTKPDIRALHKCTDNTCIGTHTRIISIIR